MKHQVKLYYSAIVILVLLPFTSNAVDLADYQVVDGQNGMIYVHGILTESACRLDMASAYQDVSLGSVTTSELRQAGDETAPIVMQIKVHDCIRQSGTRVDPRKGTLLWGDQQPIVSISFVAPANEDNPKLVAITGASGFGLKLMDSQRRQIKPGNRSMPLFLSPGENQLTYYLSAQRTAAPISPGAWQSRVNFRLNYD